MKKLILAIVLAVVFMPHALAATSESSSALQLPFSEDFSGVPIGEIPADWNQTHTYWEVHDSSDALGLSPEMKMYVEERVYTPIKLITPELDGSSASDIMLVFKHYSHSVVGQHSLRIETSTNNWANWEVYWPQHHIIKMNGEAFVSLSPVAGEKFQIAFVFVEGTSHFENQWCIDDIYVNEVRKLDMLNPVFEGAVSPDIGIHDLPLDYEIILGALPSSTWYAFNNEDNHQISIGFDPMDPNGFTVIGLNTAPNAIRGGTWADGTWYVVDNPPSPHLRTVNVEDGTMTEVGPLSVNICDIAYDEINDILYGASGNALYTINKSNGTTNIIDDFDSAYRMINIAYGNGHLYGLCLNTFSIYSIDVRNAAATLIGPIGTFFSFGNTMEYDKDQNRLFLILSINNCLTEVDLSTSRAVFYGCFPSQMTALAIPYGVDHMWEFDHWKVDGCYYSNNSLATLKMDTDHVAQAVFTTSHPTYTLTMLAPDGAGEGAVTPDPGTYVYIENTSVNISAVPAFGCTFDYWEVNNALYSTNRDETLLMDKDYTVCAFFKPTTPLPLPFTEDFSDAPIYDIPEGWNRSPNSWAVVDENMAGSVPPEIRYPFFSALSDDIRLIAPLLDGTSASHIELTFKHGSRGGQYPDTCNLFIQTSTDNGATWQTHWTMPCENVSGEVVVSLDAVAGKEFLLAFAIEKDYLNHFGWHIDDICVIDPLEPTPTESPVPTPTTTPATPTQPPTSTPTGAQTPTPTEPPTTPTEPPEPTPTETPEPTPSYPLGVRLEMPDMAHPGDEFSIIGYLDNPDAPLPHVATFFILEVYGKFWFWPSWVYFDYPEYPEIDFEYIDVPTGTTKIIVIPPFEWPDTGQDIVTGLGFYGAMLNPEMNDIMGEMAVQEWGYRP